MESSISPGAVNTGLIYGFLDTAGMLDPDVVLRTDGDSRLSGFMLYQCEYSELRFTDTLMPDLTAGEVHDVLHSYLTRRFGQ